MRVLILLSLFGLALAGCTTPEGPTHEVTGTGITFEEGDLTIAVGETVSFRMVQGSHTVDFAEGDAAVPGVSQAHSGNLDEGDVFEVTFTEPGTYPYFCAYHSSVQDGERIGMVGTITVR